MRKIIFVAALITFFSSSNLFAETVDIQKFVQETQKVHQGVNVFRLVWWIPTEYWREAFRDNPNMTESQKETFCRAVDDYIVFSVIDAKTTDFGSIIPASREQIISKLSLSIGQGKKMKTLADTEITSDAKNLFAMLKPVIANMLGQFGQGMEFVCFKGIDSSGERLLDPRGNGSFSVTLGDETSKWRLPLGCLMPSKFDLQTGEEFPGNYIYNPFTGKKLVTK